MKKNKLFMVGLSVVSVAVLGLFVLAPMIKANLSLEDKIAIGTSELLSEGLLEEMKDGESGMLGAMASPDIMSPYISFGGVREYAARDASLNAASSTVCALQSPAASSTLMFASLVLTTGTTSASFIELGKSTNLTATTTQIGDSYTLGAGEQLELVASTSPTGERLDFAPNEYLVFNMATNLGLTVSPVGVCQARWIQLD